MHSLLRLILPVLALTAVSAAAAAAPLVLPFDFSRSALALSVTVRGTPLHVLLDTGVNPSVIDLRQADALGISVDRGDGGEATGFGDGRGAAIFPSHIDRLRIAGRDFAPVEALATDMTGISAGYGRRLDAILGYSFLSDKTVLVDYPRRLLAFLDDGAEAAPLTSGCRTRWSTPLTLVDSFPVIPDFRFGDATAPVSLDTGSNGGIALFRSALALPGLQSALSEQGSVTHAGARGAAKAKTYALAAPVGFGPFTLPAGQAVMLHKMEGSADTRVANVGNTLLEALHLTVLFDYRAGRMTFYGDCPGRS
ncbi:retropepsin-like aspartic protease [Oleisolibacter albus]|uniref:retropepsin-like aspartic protease n=1 Tax=Oleisolibacter albus TaxID=2171757 RepID=UPI00138FA976|nr:retropepsin-like aspartic protease [Oleisolibacter albus]